jgi:hypothetical protein
MVVSSPLQVIPPEISLWGNSVRIPLVALFVCAFASLNFSRNFGLIASV